MDRDIEDVTSAHPPVIWSASYRSVILVCVNLTMGTGVASSVEVSLFGSLDFKFGVIDIHVRILTRLPPGFYLTSGAVRISVRHFHYTGAGPRCEKNGNQTGD